MKKISKKIKGRNTDTVEENEEKSRKKMESTLQKSAVKYNKITDKKKKKNRKVSKTVEEEGRLYEKRNRRMKGKGRKSE